MFQLVDEAFGVMIANLSAPEYNKVDKTAAVELEKKINEQRNLMRKENLLHMSENRNGYNVNSAMVYNNLFSSLERVGDHIINVSEGGDRRNLISVKTADRRPR